MLRQSTAAALQMSAPAPSTELESHQAEGLCAVPFSPTFSPSTLRNLATASCISRTTPHTDPLPPSLPTKRLRKQYIGPGNPTLECPLVATLGTSPIYLEIRCSAPRPREVSLHCQNTFSDIHKEGYNLTERVEYLGVNIETFSIHRSRKFSEEILHFLPSINYQQIFLWPVLCWRTVAGLTDDFRIPEDCVTMRLSKMKCLGKASVSKMRKRDSVPRSACRGRSTPRNEQKALAVLDVPHLL
ncbi:uncharacterized protein LOC120588201 isoform X2 [Pteropus medius]|uniref:uncharacterized protein LOC120588201 isoform X2 n=1 Tax=Pteropus vampyrus TaxID=132908 RepID=UPI00196B148A|nr:uncharacterized protein LOC120588201 isoform X2 [Pteropus giganteus]